MEEERMQSGKAPAPQKPKGKWFGRGIYGSKDVPIRVLDGLIAVLISVTLVMIIYFAVNGGFEVSFDTQGGSQVETQKLRYSDLVQEPEEPFKPGYEFQGWYVEEAGEQVPWDFAAKKVGGDLTLYARWVPAEITVKFDLNGGLSEEGSTEIKPLQVIFGEAYGELPGAVKDGSKFAGWEYDGNLISPDTKVQMTGEHILTALWQ